jgi:hypothetical protein
MAEHALPVGKRIVLNYTCRYTCRLLHNFLVAFQAKIAASALSQQQTLYLCLMRLVAFHTLPLAKRLVQAEPAHFADDLFVAANTEIRRLLLQQGSQRRRMGSMTREALTLFRRCVQNRLPDYIIFPVTGETQLFRRQGEQKFLL